MAVIYITEADNTQHKFRLPAEAGVPVTIGRGEDCLISMPGIMGLSGLHCSISLVEGQYVITDEGSSNGTMDGSRAISSEPLREGVAYGIGNAFLFFDAETPAAASAEPAPEVAAAPAPEAVAEPLAEPIPVSEYAAYAEAPAPEPVQQEAPAPVKKKRKAASSLARVQRNMAAMKSKREAMTAVNYVYVLLVLAFAFYAGMTLRHWQVTGEWLPNFDSSPAKAAKK